MHANDGFLIGTERAAEGAKGSGLQVVGGKGAVDGCRPSMTIAHRHIQQVWSGDANEEWGGGVRIVLLVAQHKLWVRSCKLSEALGLVAVKLPLQPVNAPPDVGDVLDSQVVVRIEPQLSLQQTCE